MSRNDSWKNMLWDSELKVMNIIWREEGCEARLIANELLEQYEWSKTTTYTIIKKCISKGLIQRVGPRFLLEPILPKSDAQNKEIDNLVRRVFDGSKESMIAYILGQPNLTADQLERILSFAARVAGDNPLQLVVN